MDDPHDLQRFVDAQDPVYHDVRLELGGGQKRSHWMWFVFPQWRSLGHSLMARRYGIASRAEAEAYWNHPILGPRLKECADLVLAVRGRTARELMGTPDDRKLRSCMTLFAAVAPDEPVFRQVLEKYFDGQPDDATLALL
jgi:uncharacterized protein (DUF1810 family)